MPRDIQLIGPAYADESLTFSAQDTVNWIPVPDESGMARSPLQLRGLPGMLALSESVQTLEITGDAPDTTEDVPGYSYTYTVTGGVGPYTFAITSGSLPTGLSLGPSTGTITGTPTDAGTFSFVVRVTDSNGLTDSLPDSIGVAVAPSIVDIRSTGFDTSAGTQTLNVPIPATTQVGDTLLFYCYDLSPNTFQGLTVPSGTSIGSTTSLSGTETSGMGGPRVGSTNGQGMIARSQDVSNGFVPCVYAIAASSAQNVVVVCIKIPSTISIASIASVQNQLSGSATGIDPPSQNVPFGPSPDDFLVFAFNRVTGGASVASMPYTVKQDLVTGPGTTGNNGTAQTVAACYGGIINGSVFNPGAFGTTAIATTQYSWDAATLILRKA